MHRMVNNSPYKKEGPERPRVLSVILFMRNPNIPLRNDCLYFHLFTTVLPLNFQQI